MCSPLAPFYSSLCSSQKERAAGVPKQGGPHRHPLHSVLYNLYRICVVVLDENLLHTFDGRLAFTDACRLRSGNKLRFCNFGSISTCKCFSTVFLRSACFCRTTRSKCLERLCLGRWERSIPTPFGASGRVASAECKWSLKAALATGRNALSAPTNPEGRDATRVGQLRFFDTGSLQSVGIDIDSIIECLCVHALQLLVQFDTCPFFCFFKLWSEICLSYSRDCMVPLACFGPFFMRALETVTTFLFIVFFSFKYVWGLSSMCVGVCVHACKHAVRASLRICEYASPEISSTCRVLTHRASRTGTMFHFVFLSLREFRIFRIPNARARSSVFQGTHTV